MATTTQFVRAITEKNYPAAKELFLSLVNGRMEQVVRQQYQDEAKTFLTPDGK